MICGGFCALKTSKLELDVLLKDKHQFSATAALEIDGFQKLLSPVLVQKVTV